MGLFNRRSAAGPIATTPATARSEDIGVDRAAALHASGVVLLDVREADEWHAGHAPRAVHLPLGRLSGQLQHLRSASHVLVVCRSGGRSRQATDLLHEAGVRASNVLGGMRAWADAGHPLVASTGDRPEVR